MLKIRSTLLCLFALAGIAAGDVIYLKNGMYIVVRKSAEKDHEVEYWVGGTKYSIPKSSVQRIEAGDGPRIQAPAGIGLTTITDLTRHHSDSGADQQDTRRNLELPMPDGPKLDDPYWAALQKRIVQGDRVSRSRLSEIEMENNAQTTINAFFLAGVVEEQHGSAEVACAYFEHALKFQPDNPILHQWHAIALSSRGKYKEAGSELERAAKLRPDSANISKLLGLAQYDAGYLNEAIASWRRALKLSPDAATDELLQKAERELDIERRSRERQSWHFALQYEGDRITPELKQELLDTLEAAYRDLAQQFNFEPAESISVILYTQKEFFDITQAPSWAGALNDGKLRIPIRGLGTMTPELQQVLRHELTHSFVRSIAGTRCPTWLNEGLAQLMEPHTPDLYAHGPASFFQQEKVIPLAFLERPFFRLSTVQAQVAYAESLFTVEYLHHRYGMNELVRILQAIGSGSQPEGALQHSTGFGYPELERKVSQYLAEASAQ